ncbi:hypothetical protein ACE1ET_20415, partial [Saccharicrinis sp. FJH62]|uniref:hypothetical protein n=1 Tax=Saccharicrinis sp. FJH62 TaxID=3344657 RepID=UPI0035D458C7
WRRSRLDSLHFVGQSTARHHTAGTLYAIISGQSYTMIRIDEILKFIKEQTGLDSLESDSDIFELGIVGDDFDELIVEFSEKYKIKMDSYLWYFHANEEGLSIGGLFFKSPNKRVNRIPITPKFLLTIANQGFWNIDYPKHELPKYRLDIIINKILVAVFVIIFGYTIIHKFIN